MKLRLENVDSDHAASSVVRLFQTAGMAHLSSSAGGTHDFL